MFVTSLNASCRTMRKKTTPLGSWQDGHDGLERLRHASFELQSPLVLEIPAQHPQDLPWEAEVRRQGLDHKKADSLECLRQASDQSHSPLILCFCSCTKSLHFQQYLPHCALNSSISTIRGVPINSILLLPLHHFWCSQSFSSTDQRWRKRN